jgi:hypothetical protein
MQLPELIDTYCQAWSDPSPERRAELLAGSHCEGVGQAAGLAGRSHEPD